MSTYRTVSEAKQFISQMLHQDETDTLLAGSTPLSHHNMLEHWLIDAFDRIAQYKNWRFFEEEEEFTWGGQTSAFQGAVLFLPHRVSKIFSIYPQSSQLAVDIVPARDFDYQRPNIRNRDLLVEWGYYGVEADNPSAAQITVTSDAAADADDGQKIKVTGLSNTSPKREIINTVTLSSSTATTTDTFAAGRNGVRDVELVPGTTAFVGNITVANGSTTLAYLDGTRERKHENIRTELFAPIGGVGSYLVRYYRRPFNVTADNDIIPLPGGFHDVLETLMMKQLYRWRGQMKNVLLAESEYKMRMKEFSGWDNRRPGTQYVLDVKQPWGTRTV